MPQPPARKISASQIGREAARDCAVLLVALLALLSVRIGVSGDAASNPAASASLLPVQPAVAGTHEPGAGSEPEPERLDFDWQVVKEDGRELMTFVRESIEQDGSVTLDMDKLRVLTIQLGERLGVELEAVEQVPAVRRMIHRLKADRCEDARSADASC